VLATVEDVEQAIGLKLKSDEIGRTEYYLQQASDLFTECALQKFLPAESRVRLFPQNGMVRLIQAPVIEVLSVQDLDGNDLDYTFDGFQSLYDLDNGPVIIEYEHGSDDVPQDVVNAVVRMVVRAVAHRGVSLTPTEEVVANRYRLSRFVEEV
jgi:hypothetical protein